MGLVMVGSMGSGLEDSMLMWIMGPMLNDLYDLTTDCFGVGSEDLDECNSSSLQVHTSGVCFPRLTNPPTPRSTTSRY